VRRLRTALAVLGLEDDAAGVHQRDPAAYTESVKLEEARRR
jgi:hypothetical protein